MRPNVRDISHIQGQYTLDISLLNYPCSSLTAVFANPFIRLATNRPTRCKPKMEQNVIKSPL